MSDTKPRVVIIGAGFGGLFAARTLAGEDVEVFLIDRNNYHTFTPLLYQVATCALDPSEIAYPIRNIFRNKKNIHSWNITMIHVHSRPQMVFFWPNMSMLASLWLQLSTFHTSLDITLHVFTISWPPRLLFQTITSSNHSAMNITMHRIQNARPQYHRRD